MPTATVETPFGPIQVSAVSATKIVLQAGHRTNGEYDYSPLVINGVEIACRITLEKVGPDNHRARIQTPNGTTDWTFDCNSYTVDPRNWRRMNERPSASAQNKIRHIVIPAVIAFLDANPDMLQDGEIDRVSYLITSKRAEIVRLQEELLKAEQEYRELIANLEQLKEIN